MKKLALAAAVVATLSFASCGNKNAETTTDTLAESGDTTIALVEEVDSTGDTTAAAAVVANDTTVTETVTPAENK